LLTKRTYLIPALTLCLAFPAIALAAGDGAPRTQRVGVADAEPAGLAVLRRPVIRFHRTIQVTVARLERARRAEARRQRRERFATLPGGVSQETLDAIAACEIGRAHV